MTVDEAMIAVLIAAMDANRHVSAAEARRAHHIIWSMRRFRRRAGEKVNRLIEDVRDRMERDGTGAVLDEAARTIPARLRPSAFAVAVDLMLADTTLERAERAFVKRLAAGLKMRPAQADAIVRALLIKNGA
jgi:tellurite resistance protein